MDEAHRVGICDLCGRECDSHKEEGNYLVCSYQDCGDPEGGGGSMYHQDCVETYLARAKLEKNRKTGFRCPRGCGKGSKFDKGCPGKIQKSHPIHPRNEEKQKKFVAAIAVPLAPSLKPSKEAKAKGKVEIAEAAKLAASQSKPLKPPPPPPRPAPPPPPAGPTMAELKAAARRDMGLAPSTLAGASQRISAVSRPLAAQAGGVSAAWGTRQDDAGPSLQSAAASSSSSQAAPQHYTLGANLQLQQMMQRATQKAAAASTGGTGGVSGRTAAATPRAAAPAAMASLRVVTPVPQYVPPPPAAAVVPVGMDYAGSDDDSEGGLTKAQKKNLKRTDKKRRSDAALAAVDAAAAQAEADATAAAASAARDKLAVAALRERERVAALAALNRGEEGTASPSTSGGRASPARGTAGAASAAHSRNSSLSTPLGLSSPAGREPEASGPSAPLTAAAAAAAAAASAASLASRLHAAAAAAAAAADAAAAAAAVQAAREEEEEEEAAAAAAAAAVHESMLEELCITALVSHKTLCLVRTLRHLGLPDWLALAAVLRHGGDLQAALEWLLSHGGANGVAEAAGGSDAALRAAAAESGESEVDVESEIGELLALQGALGVSGEVLQRAVIDCAGDVSLSVAAMLEGLAQQQQAAAPDQADLYRRLAVSGHWRDAIEGGDGPASASGQAAAAAAAAAATGGTQPGHLSPISAGGTGWSNALGLLAGGGGGGGGGGGRLYGASQSAASPYNSLEQPALTGGLYSGGSAQHYSGGSGHYSGEYEHPNGVGSAMFPPLMSPSTTSAVVADNLGGGGSGGGGGGGGSYSAFSGANGGQQGHADYGLQSRGFLWERSSGGSSSTATGLNYSPGAQPAQQYAVSEPLGPADSDDLSLLMSTLMCR